jgi:hypothetical protein
VVKPGIFNKAEAIANAVLYEGYMLYPYRASATKNRQRCPFGTLFPERHPGVARGAEKYRNQMQCLLRGAAVAQIAARVRFLQNCGDTDSCNAVERTIDFEARLGELLNAPRTVDFQFPGAEFTAPLTNSDPREPLREPAALIALSPLTGKIHLSVQPMPNQEVFRLTVEITNVTSFEPGNDKPALGCAFASVHTILGLDGGEFVSQINPPDELREASSACSNLGTYPVLVGSPGERDVMLSSPIILYDYPQVAPESAGDFFDATEIDELLTLRVMTLTEDEKHQMRNTDARLRELLNRTEATAREQLLRTHGVVRSFRPIKDDAA